MISIYIAAALVGLGILLIQLFMGGSGEADHDFELDAGGDVAGHLEAGGFDTDTDVSAGSEVSLGQITHDVVHAGPSHGAGVTVAALFLSMRFWTYGLMAFGLVGSLLTLLALAGFVLTLVLSIGTGLAAGLTASLVFRALKGSVSSSASVDDTIGTLGEVTVPIRKGSVGKVRIIVKSKRLDVLARADVECVDVGQKVVLVSWDGDQVLVEPMKELDTGPSETR